MQFVDILRAKGVKITYKGETNGVLAYNYLKQIMVRPRKIIDEDVAAELMQRQQKRCGACGDLLRRFEKHHKKPFSQGGTDDIDNIILLCPPCHATETEKQEQASSSHNVYIESHLSPPACTKISSICPFQDNCIGAIQKDRCLHKRTILTRSSAWI